MPVANSGSAAGSGVATGSALNRAVVIEVGLCETFREGNRIGAVTVWVRKVALIVAVQEGRVSKAGSSTGVYNVVEDPKNIADGVIAI